MAIGPDPSGALVALHRFGLGARGAGSGDFTSAASDPRGFVKAELMRPSVTLLDAPELLDTPTLLKALFIDQQRVNAERKAAAMATAAPTPAAANSAAMTPAPGMTPAAAPRPAIEQETYRAEALARFQRAATADVGFAERLVAFWSNHFCISSYKSQIDRIAAGSFEREAIRPHVFGRFADMVKAVEQHPAMLEFLDNEQSVGPNSRFGLGHPSRGLNENLGREIMELHTLGVGSGYTQADVTTLAKIITGWTFAGARELIAPAGTFAFVPQFHEPGPQTLLGKTYPDTGVSQGEAALLDIARRPETAKFIATKLLQHFVSDTPPQPLVDRIAAKFRDTEGDLHAVSMALLDDDDAWSAPLTKMRNPYEFLISISRLLNFVPNDANPILGGMAQLGMPLWSPPAPNGFPDVAAAWGSPEGMKLRLDLAARTANQVRNPDNPSDMLATILGAAASDDTRQAVARAATKQQGLALLIMSPEMQRR